MNQESSRGLYVHVPFCVRKCSYCDFYSVCELALMPDYVTAVLKEADNHSGLSFSTIYLGGGTPSLLGPGLLNRLVAGLRSRFDFTGISESTIEANPDSVTEELLAAAGFNGVNRISIGVQSLSDAELEAAGRIHNSAQAVRAVSLAVDHGLKVSADLIIGLPGQNKRSVTSSLERLIRLGINHLSVYCLSLEPGTPMAAKPPVNLPTDDKQAELFEAACKMLEDSGFIHYEISNFARPGHECRHNLNYWRGGQYLGLGPAAASHLNGERFNNLPELHGYLQHPGLQVQNREMLGKPEKAAEEAMLRLRLLEEGLDFNLLRDRYGPLNVKELKNRLDLLLHDGCLSMENGKYRLLPSHVLISNPVFARVLPD